VLSSVGSACLRRWLAGGTVKSRRTSVRRPVDVIFSVCVSRVCRHVDAHSMPLCRLTSPISIRQPIPTVRHVALAIGALDGASHRAHAGRSACDACDEEGQSVRLSDAACVVHAVPRRRVRWWGQTAHCVVLSVRSRIAVPHCASLRACVCVSISPSSRSWRRSHRDVTFTRRPSCGQSTATVPPRSRA
jgi:hypothetical protein